MITKINFQPPTKADITDGRSLLVHSIFFTIQGEGPNVGKPAVFVRLGGCNLQCPGCDTEYTNGNAHEPVDSILTRIGMAFGDYKGERLVVITGGEPFRQSLEYFLNHLFDAGYLAQIECNGTLGFQKLTTLRQSVWRKLQIMVSPKAAKIAQSLEPFIVAYKYVLDSHNVDITDGLPTSVLGLPARPARPFDGFDGEIYIQPADQQDLIENRHNVLTTIASAKKFGYRICLQTHKYLEVE